jgi:Uma2 family endonuclease
MFPMPDLVVPDLPDISKVPTQDDLPCDDGIPMETFRHKRQMDLLIDVLDAWLEARGDGFSGGNMFLYYSLAQVQRKEFIGPDFFVALDVPLGERKSWVSWEEGKVPDVVVELLSATTKRHDKTDKKTLYARKLRIPEYFWYDPFNPLDFSGFSLRDDRYEALPLEADGRFHSQQLDLRLGRWEGKYKGIEAVWVRWFTPAGEMLPTADEAAIAKAEAAEIKAENAEAERDAAKIEAETAKSEAETAKSEAETAKSEAETAKSEAETARSEAETARQRAADAETRAARLVAKLKELGISEESLK